MPTILLIRHGENAYVKKGRLAGRLPGVHLNDTGRAQAAALAEALRGLPIQGVYSSPLERTMETAAPLAEALGQPVRPLEGLLEVDFGAWQDKTLKSLRRRKLWRIVQAHPARMRFPEGETFAQAQQRIVSALESIVQAHPDPKALLACISHSDLIKLAVAYYLGLPLDLFQRLHIAPASITALHLPPEGGAALLALNYRLDWLETLRTMLTPPAR
ncbi:MAG: histidine phosphatase family protein [Anaerolineales bacterium]